MEEDVTNDGRVDFLKGIEPGGEHLLWPEQERPQHGEAAAEPQL